MGFKIVEVEIFTAFSYDMSIELAVAAELTVAVITLPVRLVCPLHSYGPGKSHLYGLNINVLWALVVGQRPT